MKKPTPIKLTKAGVFLVTSNGKRRIAEPISFHAIGERLDGTKVVEIRFVDCDGKTLSEQFDMAAINPRNLSTIADALGNKGYLWPTDGVPAVEILKVVVAKIPSRRFAFVGAPGWYDDAIVTSLRQYGGTKRILIDLDTGAHLASYTKGSGSLKDWKKTVGKLAKRSTRLRLSIAAALAVPFLRPLRMDSFAINLFGQATLESYEIDDPHQMPSDPTDWLRSLPATFTDGRRLFVHAGVCPGVPIELQKEDDLLWIREPFLSSQTDHGLLVVHGHTPTKTSKPDLRSNRLNLDTGACLGGPLTAAAFLEEAPVPVAFIFDSGQIEQVGATDTKASRLATIRRIALARRNKLPNDN